MRGFILMCFAAMAATVPQQGYNYPRQLNNQYFTSAASAGANIDGYGYQPEPLISKRFYIHSAPEEEEVEVLQRNIIVGQPRKNVNVVFIKSPIAASQKTRIRIIPATNEEKTAIYVLAKKDAENDIIAQVDEPYTTTSKPEVFFIKYQTKEEAEHAQNTIKAEYDRLGGSSFISNEGFAPVSSVIGSLNAHDSGASDSVVALAEGGATHSAATTAYLPPAKKF